MIALNLAALQVVIPLIGAPLCSLFGRGRWAWLLAVLFTWSTLAVSIDLLITVNQHGPISYRMGDWPPPWGIEYRVDSLAALVLLLISAIASVVMPFAYNSVNDEIPKERHRLFYSAYLLTFAGLLGMTITGDAFNVFVFMEISSLSGYLLISLGKNRRALTASYQYLILGTVGATFFVIGVGLLYMVTGTLNMADIAERLPPLYESRVVLAAFTFLVVGLSLKLALFPLHIWLPNAYSYAPSMVSALLAATATKVAIYLLIRFMFTVFGPAFEIHAAAIQNVLIALALLAAIIGSIVAIFQFDLRRLLAFSSVAQVGYIVLGIGLATELGLIGGTVHLVNHGLMKGALFLAMGCLAFRAGGVTFDHLSGMGGRMPLTMAAVVVAGLSLIGVPGTVGFVSKLYLVRAALDLGLWPIAVIVLISSLLAVIYVWRIIEVAYFGEPKSDAAAGIKEAPWPMVMSAWILAAACLVFGLNTDLTVGVAQSAAQALLGVSP